tara:strand:- start:85 stop:1017 length:933 start_codon:yes stop_codon:yes gene_type:complete
MKVFQESNSSLTELTQESGKKAFDHEKMIQNLVENNLHVIFPSLEFLTTEYQIDNLRPDSIAFDNDRNSFVIIEYKNVKHKGVVDQGMSYYQLLQEKREAFVLLYHKKKNRVLDIENDVNWDETRVIFVSPHFTIHQKRASRSIDLPIELYEISRFANGIITFDKVESKKENSEKTMNTPRVRLDEYSEDDYLEKGKNLQPEIRNLWNLTKNSILDEFENIEFKQKKKYAGFYLTTDGSTVCSLEAQNAKLKICYSISSSEGIVHASDFVRDITNIGHWGFGDFDSELRNQDDLSQAMQVIKKIVEHKIK